MTAVFVDYYELLEVHPRADEAAIKAAYRVRIVRDHVDHNPADPLAQERTIALSEAKRVLLDPVLRRTFDHQRAFWLASGRRFPPPVAHPGRGPVTMDLQDVSLGKLLVGAATAVLLSGLFVAAKAVADRQARRRRWS